MSAAPRGDDALPEPPLAGRPARGAAGGGGAGTGAGARGERAGDGQADGGDGAAGAQRAPAALSRCSLSVRSRQSFLPLRVTVRWSIGAESAVCSGSGKGSDSRQGRRVGHCFTLPAARPDRQ